MKLTCKGHINANFNVLCLFLLIFMTYFVKAIKKKNSWLLDDNIFSVDFSGHHVPSVQSRLRTISNLTRKLSLSNSRIIENPSRRLSASSSTSRLNNNGIGKEKTTKNRCCHQLLCSLVSKQFAYKKRHLPKKKFRSRELERCVPETCIKNAQLENL